MVTADYRWVWLLEAGYAVGQEEEDGSAEEITMLAGFPVGTARLLESDYYS